MENYTHLGSAYFIHPDVNQSLIDDIYVAVADFQKQYDCRIGISQLPTHGLAVRILTKKNSNNRRNFDSCSIIYQSNDLSSTN